MKVSSMCAVFAVLALATSASAQTQISGTSKCGKPDPTYVLEAGDRPHHLFVMTKGSCTWEKPLQMAGTENKGYQDIIFDESWANNGRMVGIVVSEFANGDKTFVRARGPIDLKDGKQVGSHGTWSYTVGTGKFKNIKGHRTFKCAMEGEGTACEVTGDYELPGQR